MERRFSLLRHDHAQRITTAAGVVVEGSVARQWRGSWTPVVRGAGTAGTYELSTAIGQWTRTGDLVMVNARIILAGSITGGGTGGLQVTGLPFAPRSTEVVNWHGTAYTDGIDWTGTSLSALVNYSSSVVLLYALNDNGVPVEVPISGVAAGDNLQFTITYEAVAV